MTCWILAAGEEDDVNILAAQGDPAVFKSWTRLYFDDLGFACEP